MLDDRETIDQILTRRQALASIEAAEAQDLLTYIDRARVAGETISEAQGGRRVDAAMHELSLALKLPVPGPLNRRAHNLKTEGLIRLRQPQPGTFEWTTRTGHTYTRTPDQLPIAGWDTDDAV